MTTEEYKKLIDTEIMCKDINVLKEELGERYKTDRVCWAFVMWTYEQLGQALETEDELNILKYKFARVEKGPYRFPDVILFRHTPFKTLHLGRHAGIMLGCETFAHISEGAGGAHITRLKTWPWNGVPYIIIRPTKQD